MRCKLEFAASFRLTRVRVCGRSNLAFEAQHLLHAVQNYRDDHGRGITNWVSLSEGQQQAHGWLTVRRAL